MSTYSAYVHDSRPLDGSGLVLVSERFNWFAFLLPLFWALGNRLWLVFFGYLILSVLVQIALDFMGAEFGFSLAIIVGYRLIFAIAAPFLRHKNLERQGYRELNMVSADSLFDAEEKALETLRLGAHIPTQRQPYPIEDMKMDQVDDYNN